jgi:hypothetical protein
MFKVLICQFYLAKFPSKLYAETEISNIKE